MLFYRYEVLCKKRTVMEIKQELSQRLLQKLVLTPQLQLAIKVLQLSRLELVEEIRQQLESNPILEEEPPEEETVPLEEGEQDAEAGFADVREEASDLSALEKGDLEAWKKFVEGYNRFSTSPGVKVSTEELPTIEATVARKETLSDHLLWQVRASDLSEKERRIAEFIIGNLNDDGYLVDLELEDIASSCQCSVDEAQKVLEKVRLFDPVGVGARNLVECLLIQARTYYPHNERLHRLIENHLGDLEKRDYQKIAKALGCSVEEVKAMCEIVQRMEPRPGRAFSSGDVIYIQPDVYVFKVGDEYVTVVNEDGLPKLRLGQYYEELLNVAKSEEAKEFLQGKLRSALWFIRALHQRQNTIRKVTESIVRFQTAFFEKGISHLRPLTLREVAEDVGLHESTVSRVTTNKYVFTPRGLFELKFFFNTRLQSLDGQDVGAEAVKARIKELIDNEDLNNPLSDEQIVMLLRKENIVVARRTVAKYRKVLGIPSSTERRWRKR
jgi:RNA polymerase sigma-54 factor